MTIPTIESCLSGIQRKHILLDTCFILDAMRALRNREPVFAELIEKLKAQENVLVTIAPVVIELLKGSDLLSDAKEKRAYLEELLGQGIVLPHHPKTFELARELVLLYRKDGKDISLTDFWLGATLMQYQSMLLLTRDHDDFPIKIFDRVAVVPIQYEHGGVDTYGFFTYSPQKISNLKRQLVEIDQKKSS